MDRLHRIRLLLGDAAIEKLRKSTVMVVGCGAVGSFATEALARSGIGHLVVVDFDRIEESNINRQLFALSNNIGTPKTAAAASRIAQISPDIRVTELNLFFDSDTKLDIRPDFVIDAIDTVPSKIALATWCAKNNIPMIASMGAALKTDMTKIRVAPISKTSVCPLASRVRRAVRDGGLPDFPAVFSTESPAVPALAGRNLGSMISVTGAFGLHLADYAIKYLIQ